jgi:acetyl-CoA synthetase
VPPRNPAPTQPPQLNPIHAWDVNPFPPNSIGTAEVESALVAHPKCAEAAVVGYEHPIKGQGIYAYVTLMEVGGVD